MANVSKLPMAKLRLRNSAQWEHRVAVRHSQRRKLANRMAPRAIAPETIGSLHPCSGCWISPNVIPASPRAQSAAPTTSTRVRDSRTRPAGTTRRIRRMVTSTSGTLIAKIQRQEAWSTSWPPISGPSTLPIPPQAVQAPTARPRSSGGKVDTITASAAGREQRAGHTLERAGAHQHLDRRRERAQHRGGPEACYSEREHTALAEDVTQRPADQQQRAERQEVGVRRPLLAGQPAAEVLFDRGQGHVDDGRVDRDDGRPQNGCDENQALARGGHRDGGRLAAIRPRAARR